MPIPNCSVSVGVYLVEGFDKEIIGNEEIVLTSNAVLYVLVGVVHVIKKIPVRLM